MRDASLALGLVLLLLGTGHWWWPSEWIALLDALIVSALFLLPVAHLRWRPSTCPDLTLRLPPSRRELRAAALLVLAVAVPCYWLRYWSPVVVPLPLPDQLWIHVGGGLMSAVQLGFSLLGVLLTTVLPEEIFFRQYLQGAFDDGRGRRVLGLRLHRGILLQAAAAGLAHQVASLGLEYRLHDAPAASAGLEQAIPALVFGLCRARTGSLWPGVILHLALMSLQVALQLQEVLGGAH